ncbi:MAG: hypothetical protein MRY80_11640 [Oricola sp.]|nr:hypothetical protein [Oricola sp.]
MWFVIGGVCVAAIFAWSRLKSNASRRVVRDPQDRAILLAREIPGIPERAIEFLAEANDATLGSVAGVLAFALRYDRPIDPAVLQQTVLYAPPELVQFLANAGPAEKHRLNQLLQVM